MARAMTPGRARTMTLGQALGPSLGQARAKTLVQARANDFSAILTVFHSFFLNLELNFD